MESGRPPLRFQKETWEARQCTPEMAICEAVLMKPKVELRPEKVGEAKSMVHFRKATV